MVKRLGAKGLVACALLVAVATGSCSGCDDESTGTGAGGNGGGGEGGGGAPPVVPWDEPSHEYRVTVTVAAHPDRDRTDLPVIAELSHPGSFISYDVAVYELTGPTESTPVGGSAWSQPNGEVFEVGFTAPGLTPAGAERTFLVYYSPATEPAPWAWDADSWASFALEDSDTDGTDDGFRLTGGDYALARAFDPTDHQLVEWRQPDSATVLEQGPEPWRIAEGFSTSYQLESPTETWPAVDLGSASFDELVSAGTASWAAAGVTWTGRPEPVVHDAALSYRAFAGWPFMQMVLSLRVADDSTSYRLSGADYTGRRVYLVDSFDRMVSDGRGEESLASVWDTSMRWLVVYDSTSNRGFGWFSPAQTVLRADPSDGVAIFDSYGGAAAGSLAYRYLWLASNDKDEIVALFDAMQPGARVSAPENRDLNIVVPLQDDFFFPEDAIEVAATTPGSSLAVSATLREPDGTEHEVQLANAVDPLRWEATTPFVLDTESTPGTWTVSASTSAATAEVTFEVRLADHPKLMFSAAELPDIVARKDDPAFAEIWQSMLDAAAGIDPPVVEPAPGQDIRGYAQRLTNLALIQLVDPSQPYDELLWDYFFTMLRYPNWDADAEGSFNNLDLTVGHFLTALALVYDWHYDRLTPQQRAEVREHLREVTSRWLTTGYMRHYRDIEYPSYGSVTGNHYWINHEGVAAAAFVLADEMPEAERSAWVDHLEEDLATILSVLTDDGTSHEGVAYHSYGQINLFPWLDMRDHALGGNTATAIPWFAESVLYDAYSILPGGDDDYGGVANFGDCPPVHYNPPRTINAWLARRLEDGIAQWNATALSYPYVSPLSYLWLDPSVATTDPATLPPFHLFPDKGIFVWRSSWNDDASYLSLKSGSYFGGHEHPDAGHFILHRAGVPYVTDHGYSYRKDSAEHNLVLVDDAGQLGEGEQWMEPVDPAQWASVTASLGDAAYFDVVADPTPMIPADALTGWEREIVGVGPDWFVVHDTVAGTASMSLLWLLHGYRSTPPTSPGGHYTFLDQRLDNPWSGPAAGPWTLQPQDAAPALHLADASYASWSAVIAPSNYVPEQHPEGGYNEGLESYQVGYRLERRATGSLVRSSMALWFGDGVSAEPWSTAAVEAVRLYDGSGELVHVLWPASGSASGFHGYDVTGQMAGRRYDEAAFFGRALSHLAVSGPGELVSASSPIDLFARLEQPTPTASDPWRIVARASSATQLTVRCPQQPSSISDETGASVAFSWAGAQLTLTVPSGEHRFELAP